MNYNTILTPFKWFILENFPYIEDDFDALTNWQMFCKLGKEINKIIEKTNLTGEQVENLTNAFNELKNYIDNYFENLDVQEEINNKLDEMAISGELTEVLSEYLKLSLFIKTTVHEFYDNTSSTKYYITEIPYEDEDENRNTLSLGIPYDDTDLDKGESTVDFAISKCASVCINGGIGSSTNVKKPHGILIQNGVVLKDETYSTIEGCEVLGIKADGSFETFDAATATADEVLNAGCVNALVGWASIIVDGISVPYTPPNGVETHPRQVIARKTNGDYVIFTCDGRVENNVGMTISDVQRILQAYGNIDFAYNLDGGGSTSTVVNLQKINENIDDHYADRDVYDFLYFARDPKLDNPDMEGIYGLVSKLRQQVVEYNAKGEVPNGHLHLYSDSNSPDIKFYDTNSRTNEDGYLRINKDGFTVKFRPDQSDDDTTYLLTATSGYLRYLGDAFGQFFNYASNNGTLNIDCDTISKAGIYYVNAAGGSTHTPANGGFMLLHMPHQENSQNRTQIAFPIADNNEYIYVRRSTQGASGAYGSWQGIAGFKSGATADRPTSNLKLGMIYYDTTTHKPLWYGGSNKWYDATGTQVS